ncbi:MAG TPA: hypothetical protein VI461_09335 [Chitinophagaceae bacterium]|nr:hypothetical protein [Chitinophagaceae bacterium]
MSSKRTLTSLVLLACVMFISVFFSTCADKIKTDIIAFRALDEGLVKSSITINNHTQDILHSLDEKRMDPATAEKANYWYPKAQTIEKISREVYAYIERLKYDLKKEAGLKNDDGEESFKEADKNSVIRFFNKQGKGEELYDKMKNYKKSLLGTDPDVDSAFKDAILLTASPFESYKGNEKKFTKFFFDDVPATAAIAMLSKFQNNIKINENKIIDFCNDHVANNIFRIFDTFNAFAASSSSYVKAREEIEIVAAVGAFSRAAMPEILIDGKNVPLDVDGAAHYKFKAPAKAGKYNVTVRISYNDEEGKRQIAQKDIEYTVAQ